MKHLPVLFLLILAIVWTGVHFDEFIPPHENVTHGFDFSNVWHEELEPFETVNVDWHSKTLFIELDPALTIGSDGACQAAGALILNILEELPEGWNVYVTNDWVPSAQNPINIAWARVLAEGY